MLNMTHGSARKLTGLAIAAGLTIGGFSLAAPASADEPKSGDTEKFVKRIEIRESIGRKDVVVRDGDHDRMVRTLANCDGEKFEAGSQGGTETKKENIKFMICARKGESLLPALEKAAARIERETEMPAERKAEILSQLRAKIAELRARS